jgi:DNA-binding beta-propeller fold protein YncE
MRSLLMLGRASAAERSVDGMRIAGGRANARQRAASVTPPKRTLMLVISACMLLGCLLVGSVPASASRNHVFSASFGAAGAGEGQFTDPEGVAVNESTGDVYVVDSGNDRVEYFSSVGGYVSEFNGSGSNAIVEGTAAPAGQFSAPQGIAVDNDPGSPSFGDVYVADTGHDVIDKFSSTGAYIGQLAETSGGSKLEAIEGIAVDSGGLLWVYRQSAEIDSFSGAVANEFLSSRNPDLSGFGGPAFAVDSNDNSYVKSSFEGISKVNSSGEVVIGRFDSLLIEPFGVELKGAAVDLPGNEVYIDNADNAGSVGRFSSTGSFIDEFGSEHLNKGTGIAVNAATGEVYVADSGVDKVDIFALEPPSRPTVESESASAVTATSATLGAQIKPTGPDTTYYFQYGTVSCAASPSSCADLPASPGIDIGSGFNGQSVNVLLQGLLPATVYHFRIVAVNSLGAAEGPEKTFTTQLADVSFTQPDGRAWELVTPPDKHGAGVIAVGNEQGDDIQAAQAGGGITYGATSPFVANPAGSNSPEVTQVISTRDAPGVWKTLDITTPHNDGPTELAVGHSAEYKLFSSDLSLGLVEPMGHTPLPPLPAGAEKTVYLRQAGGEYQALVSSANVPPGSKFGGNGEGAGGVAFVTGTPDMSHIVLQTSENFGPVSLTPGFDGGLFEWVAGQLHLVSVLPNGQPVQGTLGGNTVRNAISEDGSRLAWSHEGTLYLRDMVKGETLQVAEGSTFQAAGEEDSRVFATSEGNLSVFEVTSGKSEPLAGKLTDLTLDANPGESADVRGVIGASDDGSYVYFVANGVLGDGAERGAKSGNCEHNQEFFQQACNLYEVRYDVGTKAWAPPTFIAALSGSDRPTWGGGAEALKQMTSRVSPNGRYLAFMSERSLTGYENRDANSGVPDEEVFLYDANTGRLGCASCDPTGARPVGLHRGNAYEEDLVDYAAIWNERWLAGNIPGWTTTDLTRALYQSRYLSNSGRLFFDSNDALVPADVNGREDVYEYEPTGVGSCQPPGYGQSASNVFVEGMGGCVALISAGTSSEESAFMDASETGSDVFFLTLSRLSPQDFDTSIDLYNAHECTASAPCAPAAAAVPPPCTTGDACKPAPSPQPAIFGAPSSATFSGAGNIVLSASKTTVTPRSLSQAQKLAKTLKACRKKPKRKRATCERQARKRYRAKKARAGKSLSAGTRR